MSKPAKASTAAAIQRCREAYLEAQALYIQNNGGPQRASEYFGEKNGKMAFVNAMPQLSNRQCILDFIACVADGILFNAIREKTSSKLICAAHAALRALPGESKSAKKQKNTPRGAQTVNRVASTSNNSKQSELVQTM